MNEKPGKPMFREMPGPGSLTRTALCALIAILAMIGFNIAGQMGLIVGIVVGAVISISGLLYWATRPQ